MVLKKFLSENEKQFAKTKKVLLYFIYRKGVYLFEKDIDRVKGPGAVSNYMLLKGEIKIKIDENRRVFANEMHSYIHSSDQVYKR